MNWVEAGGSERVQAKTDFEEIVKALAAFQALWRTSRANSDGIDDVHRFLMSGRRSEAFLKDCPSVSALARRIKDENCSLRDPKFVRHQLRLFLKHASPSIGQKADWLNTLAFTPVYKAAPHAKFVLLLAGQHAVKDVSNPGLQKKGDNGGVKYIDYTSSQAQWTIEHVQPQATVKQTWGSDQLLHTLGNLTLLPQPVNSMLSDQSWVIKRKVFTLLTSGEELTLDKARAAGMSQATSQFIANHNASWKKSHLLGLADVVDWTPEHVQARSKNLGELAFLTLEKWIGFYE
jgi:hypothetical protein